MKVAPCSGLASSRKAAEELEEALDYLASERDEWKSRCVSLDDLRREQQADVESLQAVVAAHQSSRDAAEGAAEYETGDEIVFLDSSGEQHRVVYNLTEDQSGLGSGWFVHPDDPFEDAPPKPAPDAPGHTDLMVTPESLDAWLEKNPLPAPDAMRGALERLLAAFKGLQPFPLIVQAVAEGLIRDAEAALSAPAPSPYGAGNALKIYVDGMTADNWAGMRLRCERQLNELTAALPDQVVVDSMQWLGGDYRRLQKFCGLNFGRADAHDVAWLGPNDGEQVVIWNTALDKWLCCPKGLWIDRHRDGALFLRTPEPGE
jgi:hypothetical protein